RPAVRFLSITNQGAQSMNGFTGVFSFITLSTAGCVDITPIFTCALARDRTMTGLLYMAF
ncbi:MAG: hypothetical protein ACJ8LL_08050, partial [Candidatus Udaeobacter sp.]